MLPVFQQPLTLRSLHDVADGYGSSAYAASTMITHEPSGDVAYAWLRQHVYQAGRPLYAETPKWAFSAARVRTSPRKRSTAVCRSIRAW